MNDVVNAVSDGASAVSLSSLLHYKKIGVAELKQQLAARGVEVRL